VPAGHWGALGAKSWLLGEAVAAGVVAYSLRYTKNSKSKNRILGTVKEEKKKWKKNSWGSFPLGDPSAFC